MHWCRRRNRSNTICFQRRKITIQRNRYSQRKSSWNTAVKITHQFVTLSPRRNLSVHSECFYQWALRFTEHVSRLTKTRCNLLLTYDLYRLHKSLCVLEHFRNNNIVMRALPAHLSSHTQPLDVVTFGSMKQRLDLLTSEVVDLENM